MTSQLSRRAILCALISAGAVAPAVGDRSRPAPQPEAHGLEDPPAVPDAPQHPHLLDLSADTNENGIRLAVRPSWKVAGVDYPVGVPRAVALKPARADNLPRGCALNSTGGHITVSGGGPVVLEGYDFTADGVGYGLYVNMTGPLTIRNCRFKVGTGVTAPIQYAYNSPDQGGLLTVQHCEFDGSGRTGGNFDQLIEMPSGGILAEYNWFHDCGSDGMDLMPKLGFTTAIVRYNLFEKLGFAANAHADAIQFWDGDGGADNPATPAVNDISGIEGYGNTLYQPASDERGLPVAMNSMMRIGDLGGKTCLGPVFHHNTAVAIGAADHMGTDNQKTHPALLQLVQLATTNPPYGVIRDAVVSDNYVFTAGGGRHNTNARQGMENGPFYPTSITNQNLVNPTYARNFQMRDGSALTGAP